MAIVPASIFSQIAKAKASAGGTHIRDGAYEMTVKRLLIEKGFKGWAFKGEFLVDKATKVGTVDKDGNPTNVEPNAVGSSCSMVCNFDKNESSWGNVKQFILALLGFEESQVADAEFAEAVEALVNIDPKRVEFKKQINPATGGPLVNDGQFVYTNEPERDEAGNAVLMAVQPARGMKVKCDTYQRITKNGPNAGKIGTYPKFARMEQNSEEIAARRQQLDSSGA